MNSGIDHREEADRIIEMLEKSGKWPGASQFSAKDLFFVRDLKRNPSRFVSDRMIYWLRDIKDKLDYEPQSNDDEA